MLWTAVVAVYFGVLQSLQASGEFIAILTGWIVIGWSIRVFIGPGMAFVASLVPATLLVISAIRAAPDRGSDVGGLVIGVIFLAPIVGLYVCVPLLVMELLYIVIHRIDTRYAAKEEKPPSFEEDASGDDL